MTTPSKKQISENRRLLQNPYAFLDGEGGFDAAPKVVEAPAALISANRRLLGDQYAFLGETGHISAMIPTAGLISAQASHTGQLQQSKRPGYEWIEQAARKLQEKIWQRRHELWPDGVPSDPVQLLEPSMALRLIDFDFDMDDTLGQFSKKGVTFEIAGIIDRPARHVRVSRQMPFNTRRFTAAHELAHAVLHERVHMHRDRPLDGSGQEHGSRDKIEKEADKFASFFLMPENLMRKRFRQFFLCDKFALNEATIFALDPVGSRGLLEGKKSLRELARILAKAESFNGRYFRSLADQFNVSVEAMAIRLEELELLEM